MEDLFKHWADSSHNYQQFNLKFSWWLITQEVDPDNCFSNEELLSKYNKYKTKV